jgi:hypothetical protein
MNQKITRFFEAVKQGFMSLTRLMTFMVGVLMIGVIFFLFISHKHDEQKMIVVQTELKQLSSIEANLNALIEHVQETPPASSQDVEVLSTQVTKIGTAISALQDQPNTPEIKAAIVASTDALTGQLNSLKQLTIAIKTAVTPKRYLHESTLPFEVVGIDVWNGEAKATIKTVNALAPPMGINETQDGWTLIQLNNVTGEAIFQNEKNQQVLVKVAS